MADASKKEEEEHPDFTGSWVGDKQEGFEDFLKAMGVGWALRKTIKMFTPSMKLKQEPGKMTRTSKGPKGEHTATNPTDGSEYEGETPRGDKFTATTKWEGSKLVTNSLGAKGKMISSTEYDGDRLLTIVTVVDSGTVYKRWWKRK